MEGGQLRILILRIEILCGLNKIDSREQITVGKFQKGCIRKHFCFSIIKRLMYLLWIKDIEIYL